MADLFKYKCPNCGSSLEFNSDAQTLKCPYCDSEINIDALKEQDEELGVKEDSFTWDQAPVTEWGEGETDGMKVYVCESCGGEIIVDKETAATKCPYCDSNVVIKEDFAGDLRPDFVIPFKINKNQAKDAYLEHLKGKKLLPKIFKDSNHIDEMKAVYVPFWLFDCDADATVRYDATNVSAWSDRDYDYVKTDHYSVLREGNISFEHVPVDGSENMADDLMQSIEPFNFSEAVDFKTAYLAGYLAERYRYTANEVIETANARIKTSAEEGMASTVTGYDSVTPQSAYVKLNKGDCRYALYPVWILNTTFKGERFIFAINGQTGKAVGNLPLDKGAYRTMLLSTTAAAGLVALVVQALLLVL